ncbi:Cysteine-rich membrane protein 1 [Spironucleus salmonicida]|uniref:Cysteine-rich membrane protein 1 n=1 Tax=Spironucleus salmonicida TaxID=348837 RepID=V6LT88_9EUKA|nr:Cysteine-rich membrane protein 1 [Spironucleus salmonicida]|eukprot:EST47862.1 Cysteine-rich membrane protein 1 [Spironucleus salmonicida]
MTRETKCTQGENSCPANTFCQIYNSKDVNCISCISGIIGNSNGCNCLDSAMMLHCQLCQDGKCIQCSKGYQIKNDQCAMQQTLPIYYKNQNKPPITCETNKYCRQYNAGYCDLTINQCVPCQSGCNTCTSATFCATCDFQFHSTVTTIDGRCTTQCDYLEVGQYCKEGIPTVCDNNATSECNCGNAPNCATCNQDNSSCGTCLPNFIINHYGRCVTCVQGYEKVSEMCIKIETTLDIPSGNKISGSVITGVIIGILSVILLEGCIIYFFIKKTKK